MSQQTAPHQASEILKRVKLRGKIKLETLIVLTKALDKAGYSSHVTVECTHPNSALLKTIDNEEDAVTTIDKIKKKYGEIE